MSPSFTPQSSLEALGLDEGHDVLQIFPTARVTARPPFVELEAQVRPRPPARDPQVDRLRHASSATHATVATPITITVAIVCPRVALAEGGPAESVPPITHYSLTGLFGGGEQPAKP